MLVVNEHLETHLVDFLEGDQEDENDDFDDAAHNDDKRGSSDNCSPTHEDHETRPTNTKSAVRWKGNFRNHLLAAVPAVGMVLVATVNASWAIVFGLLAASGFGCLRLMRWYDSGRKADRQQRVMKARREIAGWLGRIHAPPLSDFPNMLSLDVDEYPDMEFLDAMEDFAATHAQLLLSVDSCLGRLRMSSGISLGVGPISPSVERVEQSAFSGASSVPRKPSRCRLALAKVLQRQVKSIQFLAPEATEVVSLEIPGVLTLSWLREARMEVGELLSQQLSEVFVVQVRGQPLQQRLAPLSRLKTSALVGQELRCHVENVFGLTQLSTMTSDLCAERNKVVNALQQQLDVASVTLWECKSTLVANDKKEFSKWLSHFESELTTMGKTAEGLRTFIDDDDSNEIEVEDSAMVEDELQRPNSNGDGVPESYESNACEESLDPNNQREVGDRQNKKAFVFSGSGKRPIRNVSTGSSRTRRAGQSSVPRSVQAVSARTQAMLLNELETRLSVMMKDSVLEEVEVVAQDDEGIVGDTGHGEENPDAHKMFSLGGVSGGLLAELQVAIATDKGRNGSVIEE